MEIDQKQGSVLVRYSAPNKLCMSPYGQIWKNTHDDNLYSLYIQTSKDANEPHWLKMGEFLEKAFAHQITEEKFIKNCLKMMIHNQKTESEKST